MKSIKISLTILCLLCFSSVFSQNKIIAFSDDDRYTAVLQTPVVTEEQIFIKDSTDYDYYPTTLYNATIEIYEPATKKHIQNIQLKTPNPAGCTNAYFSKNNYFFCLNDNRTHHIWNVPSGKKIKSVVADSVILSNKSNSFYVVNGNNITKQSYFYSTKIQYEVTKGRKIKKILLTTDDKFLIVLDTKRKIYIWQIGTKDTKEKSFYGDDVSVDNEGNFLIVTHTKSYTKIEKFGAAPSSFEFEQKELINSQKYIEKTKVFKTKILPDKSEFAANGNYYTYVTKKGLSKKVTTIDLNTGQTIFKSEKELKKFNKTTPYFYNDSVILLQRKPNEINVYLPNKKKISEKIESDKKISYSQVLYDDDAIVVYDKREEITLITDQESKNLTNYKYIDKNNTNKTYFFVKNQEDSIEYFPISTIMTDTNTITFEEPKEEEKKVNKEFNKFSIDTMSYISLKDIEHISKANDKNLEIIGKSIQINEDFTGVQFYLIDQDSNYYYGLSEKDYKKYICGVTIENEYGEITEIKDYEIVEYSEHQKSPVAICFVLDHSGSMGTTNANMMQTAILKLSDKIQRYEAVAIVKFDDKVEKTVDLTSSKSRVSDKFKVNGLEEFGGSTALIDGIDEGLNILIANNNYQNKALIVLTDGYENASKATKNQVLMKALLNNIGIYAIGFGSSIDVEFLKSISVNTNGGYYWINDNSQFDYVFDDIYKNMKNYYSVQFNTPYPGKYKVKIQLCSENKTDSLVYFINNYVPELLFEDDLIEYEKLFLEITGLGDTIDRDDFNSYLITQSIEFLELKKSFDTLIFPDIKFYFDMTKIVEGTDKELINVINFMKLNPNIRIEIQGHTDNYGGLLYNELLSQRRAEKVKQIMVDAGIESQRIRTIGYGETKPIATNDTDEGRQQNRRVEFLLVK